MHIFMFIFVVFLFFILTPGIILTLPAKGSKTVVAITHAIIFAIVWTIIHKFVWDWGVSNGWIIKGHKSLYDVGISPYAIEGMTLQQCKGKTGTYKDGYCYDTKGQKIV